MIDMRKDVMRSRPVSRRRPPRRTNEWQRAAREGALAALDAAWQDAGREGAVVLVEGEAGIGRTRLCREFLRRLQSSGSSLVLEAEAAAYDSDTAGATTRRLLAGLSRAPGLAGENALRAGRYDEAISAFRTALEHDSTFALASHRLAFAAEWRSDLPTASEALERAIRHRERLPRRYQLLASADSARYAGAADDAERLYLAVITRHPDEPLAWYQLGEVLIHFNPLRGRAMAAPERGASAPRRRRHAISNESLHIVSPPSPRPDPRNRAPTLMCGLHLRACHHLAQRLA
jgi:tetratricopeptide (TPR) repeat protein